MTRHTFCILSVVLLAGAARGEPISWTNASGDQDWHNPSNWDLGRVPNGNDDVTIWNVSAVSIAPLQQASARSIVSFAELDLAGTLYLRADSVFYGRFMQYRSDSWLYIGGNAQFAGPVVLFSGRWQRNANPNASVTLLPSCTFWMHPGDPAGFESNVFIVNQGRMQVDNSFNLGSTGEPVAILACEPGSTVGFLGIGTFGGRNGSIVNEGTFSFPAGSGAWIPEGVLFYNGERGVVDVSGGIALIGNPAQAPYFTNNIDRGEWRVSNGGLLTIGEHRVVYGITGSAHFVLDGLNSRLPNLAGLGLIEGALELRNGASFLINLFDPILQDFDVVNNGTLIVDQGCEIDMQGHRFVQGSSGLLSVGIGPAGPGLLTSDLGADVRGTLQAWFPPGSGYAAGDRWPVVRHSSGGRGVVAGDPALQTFGTATPMRVSVSDQALEVRVDGCRVDFNGDGFVDFFDYDDFVRCFETGQCPPGATADFNQDGFADFFDYDDFVAAFEGGC